MKNSKNWFYVFIGIVVTLVCVWLAFRRIEFIELTRIISGGNYIWLIPAIAAQILAIIIRSQRWVILLEEKVALETSFWAQGIGYLFTNLLPFRLGEVARILVMSERSKMPVVQVTGTVIVERLLDVATMILALLLVLPWMHVQSAIVRSGELFGMLVLLGILVIILLARFKEASFVLVDRVCAVFSFLPKKMILARWAELIEGLTPLLHSYIALKVVALSMLSWLFSGIVFYCAIHA